MSSKTNRSKKAKRTPVRLITARTAGLSASTTVANADNRSPVVHTGNQADGTVFVSQNLVPELKKIGILFAVMLVLLVILSLVL